jgi:hybrid cluster-associated redox disulfide protein
MKITKESNIAEIVSKYPQVAQVLTDFGLHCVGCFASSFDTIEQGAQIHEMDEEEVNELVEELNKVVENPELLNE